MTRRLNLTIVDDIDGSDATETIRFSIDGADYEIDLNAQQAEELRGMALRWARLARRTTGRQIRREATTRVAATRTREWALAQGYEISAHGPIPLSVSEAYISAQTTDPG